MFGYIPKKLNWNSTEQPRQKKIGYDNETNQSKITSINGRVLESINVRITCDKEADKHK